MGPNGQICLGFDKMLSRQAQPVSHKIKQVGCGDGVHFWVLQTFSKVMMVSRAPCDDHRDLIVGRYQIKHLHSKSLTSAVSVNRIQV